MKTWIRHVCCTCNLLKANMHARNLLVYYRMLPKKRWDEEYKDDLYNRWDEVAIENRRHKVSPVESDTTCHMHVYKTDIAWTCDARMEQNVVRGWLAAYQQEPAWMLSVIVLLPCRCCILGACGCHCVETTNRKIIAELHFNIQSCLKSKWENVWKQCHLAWKRALDTTT